MKKIKIALLILPLIMFTLHSCEEAQIGKPADGSATIGDNTDGDDDTDETGGSTNPTTSNSFMNYKLDGVEKKISDETVAGSKKDKLLSFGCMEVSGTAVSVLSITVFNFEGVKTYQDAAVHFSDMTDIANMGAGYSAVSGSLKVTSYANDVLKGTFEFTLENEAKDKKEIKNGSFSVKLEK